AEADLTNMQLELLIDMNRSTNNEACLIKLVELAPVVDDKGKVLSTKKRLTKIEELQGDVPASSFKGTRGRSGPVVCLLLDAPSRGARSIKAIKGTFEVVPAKVEKLRFVNLPSLVGKPLKHKQLKGIKVVLKITKGELGTTVFLEITGARNRLVNWT